MPTAELHQWVGNVEEFMATYWRRRPGVFDATPKAPIGIEEIDAALTGGLLGAPYLEMIREGNLLPMESYTSAREVLFREVGGFADPKAVVRLLRGGSTLLLRNIEHWHRPTARLVTALAEDVDRRVEAFFFVTPPQTQGLALHRDDADVLLLQVAGAKEWVIREGPKNGHWEIGKVAGEPGDALMRTTLTAGQVLYIPRGYAHSAVGSQGLSLHLSLTIREVGGRHLAQALSNLLLDGPPQPVRPLDEEGLLASSAALLEAARTRLAVLSPRDLVESARLGQRQHFVNGCQTTPIGDLVTLLAGDVS